jgi:hypothetical protein
MVDMVDMVDNPEGTKAVSLAEEGSNVNLPGEQRSNVNLRYDEHGCPLPPVGLVDPEPPVQPILLPVLDLGTRLERVLDSVDLFDQSPGAQLRSWIAPLYPDHWDL